MRLDIYVVFFSHDIRISKQLRWSVNVHGDKHKSKKDYRQLVGTLFRK